MQDVAHEEFFFFWPTEPLAVALVEQNRRLVAESLIRVSPADELGQAVMEDDEPAYDSVAASAPGRAAKRAACAPEEQTRRLQRLMGERLYHFLATLAESPHAQEGGKFSIWEFIPQGMANMLGLAAAFSRHEPESERVMHLLREFTGEFRDWLVEQNRSYVCAWGEIHLDEDDRLMLQTYAFDETQGGQVCAQEARA